MSLDDKSEYVIVLHSWFDKNSENIQYLKWDKSWRRGDWVNTIKEATLVNNKGLADKIAWYWGVAYKEVLE